LDGELLIIKNSKPDFYALQTRSLITDPLKIKIQMKFNPVIYIAFDLLYLDNQSLINTPLLERKKLLSENLQDTKNLVVSKYLEGKGTELFKAVKKLNLEGIVAKEKLSYYYPGKRSSVWLKIKVYQEEDLIICGYLEKGNVIELIMGKYVRDELEKACSVITGKFKKEIIEYGKTHTSLPLFPLNEDITWINPYLVGTVRYMMKTKKGGLRQPVFLGVRSDKFAEDLK
ncbi:MAG: DNA ligase, partial [Bacilli bacterium]|nr:DNA ligase [Bacilli bacterium]